MECFGIHKLKFIYLKSIGLFLQHFPFVFCDDVISEEKKKIISNATTLSSSIFKVLMLMLIALTCVIRVVSCEC